MNDICDRCKREIPLDEDPSPVLATNGSDGESTQRELCQECLEALLEWIEGTSDET